MQVVEIVSETVVSCKAILLLTRLAIHLALELPYYTKRVCTHYM